MQENRTLSIFLGVVIVLFVLAVATACYFVLRPSSTPETENTFQQETVSNLEATNTIQTNSQTEKVWNIYSYEYSQGSISLDLDGDAKKETILLNGSSLEIDGKSYSANPFVKENEAPSYGDYAEHNTYYLLDLNGDGYVEIIHKTYSSFISPITNSYTFYQYKNQALVKVGECSIIGNIPKELHVRGNTLTFSYWPYEAPETLTQTCTVELDVQNRKKP